MHAVGEVAAVGQVHGDDGITGLQCREIDGHVGAGAGVWLDIGRLGAEQLAGPLDGEQLNLVHRLAAAVVSFAGITLGVFVGENATLGGEDGGRGVVLAGDHLEAGLLPLAFGQDGFPDGRVARFDRMHGRFT